MAIRNRKPIDLATRVARRRRRRAGRAPQLSLAATMPLAFLREEARAKAREMIKRLPKAAYITEIKCWRELSGDR